MLENELRHLFADTRWGAVSARFELNTLPPDELISNVNLVPYIGDRWVVIRTNEGRYEVPGGTREAGETYLDTLCRELMEEAGAELVSFKPLGAWLCTSSAPEPYKPHLPHPTFYRLAGVGEVRLAGRPANPPGGETIVAVEIVSLAGAQTRFRSCGRYDLADLYLLAARSRG
ncbi:MAG: NUDIX domain-containing protein [Chloroflexota bacterium]|nr:MAG: NUDIX hydrolase [Chloroflexota bacterium]